MLKEGLVFGIFWNSWGALHTARSWTQWFWGVSSTYDSLILTHRIFFFCLFHRFNLHFSFSGLKKVLGECWWLFEDLTVLPASYNYIDLNQLIHSTLKLSEPYSVLSHIFISTVLFWKVIGCSNYSLHNLWYYNISSFLPGALEFICVSIYNIFITYGKGSSGNAEE